MVRARTPCGNQEDPRDPPGNLDSLDLEPQSIRPRGQFRVWDQNSNLGPLQGNPKLFDYLNATPNLQESKAKTSVYFVLVVMNVTECLAEIDLLVL